ncbi:MAG: hypothetical protein AAF748_13210 [Pseudomonadota bacterium]
MNVAQQPLSVSLSEAQPLRFVEMLMLWLDADGKLDDRFDKYLPHVDILSVSPDSLIPKILHIGNESLTANALGSSDPATLRTFIQDLPRSERAEVTTSLRTVLSTGQAAVAGVHRRITVDNRRKLKTVKFARMLLPCTVSAKGNKPRPIVINTAEVLQNFDQDIDEPEVSEVF